MMQLDEQKAQFTFKMQQEVRWSDMDEMKHVNNAVYLTYFEQARIAYMAEACAWNWAETGAILANAHVDYYKPIVYPTPTFIYVRVSKMGTKSFEISYMITCDISGREEIMTTGYTTLVVFDYTTNRSIPIPESVRQRIMDYEKATSLHQSQ